ncbi:PAS-domain containing protein [Paenibacillus sp. IB182496]|uniref:histidine kinase n=1 Tax=Paenibacillus sabuli TaxID=2772509 RepID=A0A927GQT1_9BACL|nr:ATP-binding protein [Paenibacillus sabuli]MBD2844215.1 PAS-domain containing protein [Paenibacillus sabuli]
MQAFRGRYFPALAAYVRNGHAATLQRAGELGKLLHDAHPEDILVVHEEAIHTLVANVEPEEAIQLYNRSLVFLTELMVACRFETQAVAVSSTAPAQSDAYKRMKASLQESYQWSQQVKNKYENVLQHMDSGIALFDSEGILTFVNLQMAKVIDVPRKTLIGCDIRGIVTHPQLSRSTRRMILHLVKEIVRRRSRYYELQDALGRHLLVTVTYGDQLDGEYLVSIKDVSEYKQIEQTAYQNDKLAMLGKIAAAIAHEIRNPLTSIRGFIQLLRPPLMELGKEEYARIIVAEIDRANDIIHEFLNSSKPTAPMKQGMPVDALLKEVVLLSESEALMRGCFIRHRPIDEPLLIAIDVKQVKQVLLNIVKNGLDAITESLGTNDGLIELSARRDGADAVISIRDNGMGMDRNTMNRLFDPFFTTKATGTGLGLSVSYRIIRNHGGRIQLESAIGEGTEFQIYLPLAT